ncbi:hypothetical protein [Chitinophaga alhagiae]|uniref:hypothetical protein n=1 Tax=Chitinophaga alhagiae TaxID=2203219 RepID=UPI000E5C4746|nr:hypothetical protein [Chitinophaga alhagiae]
MKYILILLAGLLYMQPAAACKCLPLPALENSSQLEGYSFIAHVKIAKIKKDGQIRVKVKELFKGERRTLVFEPAKGTSCDLFIAKGEEWLLFGKMENGKMAVHACDRNMECRAKNTPPPEQGQQLLEKLRELHGSGTRS